VAIFVGQNSIGMKKKNIFKAIGAAILSLLGFNSCDLIGNIVAPVCEYGCPHAEFKVVGTVKDADGNPIPGIQVKSDVIWTDDLKTAQDGSYAIEGEGFPTETLQLTFEDVDGEENGGKFKTLEAEAKLKQTQTGDGKWDDGSYEGSLDVTLEKE